jgi:OmpA-OmpF porin, OOP family
MTHTKLLPAVIATLMSTGALADHKFEVQLSGSRYFFEDPIQEATAGNIGLGYVINKNWTLEAVATRYNTEFEDFSDEIEGTQYRLDALYNINTESNWRPYVAFGVGDNLRSFDNNPDVEGVRDTLVNLGVGVKHSLGKYVEFRSDVRAFNSLDEEYTDLAITAGVNFLFGHSEPVMEKPMPVVVPAVVPAPVVEVDTDGDGVFDSKDKCPDTAKQYKVDAVGCPMELTETATIKLAVKFDNNKAIVKDEYLADIGNLATFMNQYANTVVTVEGHTDSVGSDVYNKNLSQKRADAVKAVLISKFNIGADRVTAVGVGEASPIADNTTATGREENRRVVGAVSTDVTRKAVR